MHEIVKEILILYSGVDQPKTEAMLSGMICITNLLCQADGGLTPQEMFKILSEVSDELGYRTTRIGS